MALPSAAPGQAPRDRTLTLLSLGALALALALGALGRAAGHPGFGLLGEAVAPLAALWVAALQMVALPLVLAYVTAAVIGLRHSATLGRLGARAVGLFVVFLAAGGAFTALVAPPLIALYPADPVLAAQVRAGTTIPAAAHAASRAGVGSFGDWVGSLLPANVFEAAVGGEVLGLLLFAILFGLAARQLPDEQRDPIARAVTGISAALMTIVRWLLIVTPIGVFALAYGLALEAGLGATGLLAAFVVIVSLVMMLWAAVLYPVTALLGRVSLRAFARAVAPAQVVAFGTRSSIAALPALIAGATQHLRLPPLATSFVLPFAIALFKPNRTLSSTVKLLFVAHAFGVALDAWAILTFVATVILLSFSAVGVPGGGSSFKTLPAYLAAGLPIEGVVIMEVVDTIPDIFKTVLNVTGDMSAATILSRTPGVGVAVAADGALPGQAA